MSKNVAVFVDVANLYYSARGQEVDVDYVALLKAATKGRDLIRAYAYSGLDPENENQRKFIDFLNKNGYKVIHKDIRKFGDGRVKANLDIELVVDLFRLADRMDIAVVISGDGDFAPAIRALQDKGVRCEVISFRPNTSSDLIAVADEFIDIMKIIGIGRGKDGEKAEKADKIMSAPPMPAKEVVPEFGFREAPASVAAAALAALREGKDTKEGKPAGRVARGRGRGRAAAEAAPAEAAAVEEVAVEATAQPAAEGVTEEGGERRRRRRRGGRGRGRGGRGRTGTEAAAGAPGEGEAAPAGEIGWVELDDISQVDDFDALAGLSDEEPREYTFEEADAATLAELGIAPSATAAAAEAPKPRRPRTAKATTETAAAPAAEAPKPRRSRAAKPKAEEPAPATEATSAPKPRRSRAAKPKAEEPAPAAEATSAPKPRRSRAATGPEATPDATEDGQEGIWQRFRSGRTS